MTLYVTEDWSRFVAEDDPEARFGVAPVDVDRLGLRPALDRFEAKSMAAPANKAMKLPANKAGRPSDHLPAPAGK